MDAQPKIAQALTQAAQAHHQEFAAADGHDPHWPDWYARWLLASSDLLKLIKKEISESRLSQLLAKFDREFAQQKDVKDWQDFYAENLLKYAKHLP